MIIDSKLKIRYGQQRPYFEHIQNYLDQTLMNYAKKHLYAYTSRIKELNSICEKIETGRYRNWSELDDFVGCVLIIPNLGYEEDVLKFFEKTFNRFQIRKKGNTYKSYDVFRFDSTRFIGTINPDSEGKTTEIHKIKFEIQIRSAFEHAWSVTTHDLTYKSKFIDWKLLRLTSQLKSSVEQLDMISLGALDASKHITKFKWPEVDIKSEVLKYLQNHFDKGTIPQELKPKNFSRVVDNIYALISSGLSLWTPRKWLFELKAMFEKIDIGITELNNTSFPMSLSLYQIVFGIIMKNNLVSRENLSKTIFFKPESFYSIFPELKDIKINEFKI